MADEGAIWSAITWRSGRGAEGVSGGTTHARTRARAGLARRRWLTRAARVERAEIAERHCSHRAVRCAVYRAEEQVLLPLPDLQNRRRRRPGAAPPATRRVPHALATHAPRVLPALTPAAPRPLHQVIADQMAPSSATFASFADSLPEHDCRYGGALRCAHQCRACRADCRCASDAPSALRSV